MREAWIMPRRRQPRKICFYVFTFSEARDRRTRFAEWARARREVLRRLVLRERHVRHSKIGNRLEPIVDLHRREDRATRLPHQRGTARERLAGIPHIIGQQDALAFELVSIKRAQRESA